MEQSALPAAAQARLKRVMAWSLEQGSHERNDDGHMCAMEAAAWVAGEPWSASPACVSPSISAFLRSWNDSLPTDADRDRLLKPLIAATIGTRTTPSDEQRRAFLAMDWLVRVWTPKWLDLVPALRPHAVALRDCEEICDAAGLVAATAKLSAAREASDAAWDAARAAAWDAAWDVAWDIAWAAAWAVARAVALDAASKKLSPTVEWCQQSAVDLVKRMCEIGRVKEAA